MAASSVSVPSSSSAASVLLDELMNLRVTRRVIDYCVNRILDAVEFAMGYSPPPFVRGRTLRRRHRHHQLTSFVAHTLSRAQVSMPVILTAMVYMDRIKTRIHISGHDYMPERLFIGAIIVASRSDIVYFEPLNSCLTDYLSVVHQRCWAKKLAMGRMHKDVRHSRISAHRIRVSRGS
ncbi:hypothetical protein CPB85DRAFT_868251 [Mucidula mucida]|nr:hypothetical protein CPB85DRAFT_868251 [Mucidula mucida]